MIFIDTVQYGVGFSESGSRHAAQPVLIPFERKADDPLNAARGIVWGLLLSSVLWIGLVGIGRAVLTLITGS